MQTVEQIFKHEQNQSSVANPPNENALQNRENFAISLRKQKKAKILDFKRKRIQASQMNQMDPAELQILLNAMHKDQDVVTLIEALKYVRHITCQGNNSQQYKVIVQNDNLIKTIVEIINDSSKENWEILAEGGVKVLSETFWIIANLMFDKEMVSKLFVEMKIVDAMLGFLTFNFLNDDCDNYNQDVKVVLLDDSQSQLLLEYLFCIGNIAGDSTESRYFVTEAGFEEALYLLVQTYKNQFTASHWQLIMWIFRSLSQRIDKIDPFILFITNHLIDASHKVSLKASEFGEHFKKDATALICNVINEATDEEKQRLQADNFITGFTMGVLSEMDPQTVMHCVNIIGDIIATNSNQCQLLVSRSSDGELVKILEQLFNTKDADLQQRVLWIISNIVLNSEEDAQFILHNTELFYLVVGALRDVQSTTVIKEEALWIVMNAISTFQDPQDFNKLIYTNDIITQLNSILQKLYQTLQEPTVLLLTMTAFSILFKHVGNKTKESFEQIGGIDILERLAANEYNEEIRDKSSFMLAEYFDPNRDQTNEKDMITAGTNQFKYII